MIHCTALFCFEVLKRFIRFKSKGLLYFCVIVYMLKKSSLVCACVNNCLIIQKRVVSFVLNVEFIFIQMNSAVFVLRCACYA